MKTLARKCRLTIELNGDPGSRTTQAWAKGEEGEKKWGRNGQRGITGTHRRGEEGMITGFGMTAESNEINVEMSVGTHW